MDDKNILRDAPVGSVVEFESKTLEVIGVVGGRRNGIVGQDDACELCALVPERGRCGYMAACMACARPDHENVFFMEKE
ncbi:MAG: hypothetical protein LBH06_00820 [Rikenellaceae bacterium]|jgi:hypothetical protein|nr:hypothetical protein [Rikenellaceae bacterium]